MKGDLEHALADFDQAVRLDPKSATPQRPRHHLWHARGERPRHRRFRRRPQGSTARIAVALNNRGFACRNKGDDDRAIADFSEAISSSRLHGCLFNRANAYFDKRDFDRAITDFDAGDQSQRQFRGRL